MARRTRANLWREVTQFARFCDPCHSAEIIKLRTKKEFFVPLRCSNWAETKICILNIASLLVVHRISVLYVQR